MKVATIVPQNYLHLTKDDDYFMCLGHLINAPGMDKYTDFFTDRALEGKFVIMDNGLIEGDPRPITELADKAFGIGANEMILTDVFRDSKATLDAIAQCMKVLEGQRQPERLMMVPQGNTVEEWVSCAHELIKRYNMSAITIGVPKVLVDIGGRDGRAVALQELLDRCPVAKHLTYHLLGCWTTPLEVLMLDKLAKNDDFMNIRGVDSAIPFVYARAGKRIDCQDRPDSDPVDFQYTKVNGVLLRHNIYEWRRAADCTRRFL